MRAHYARITAKAWSDPAFKARLLSDPHVALREAGIDIPAGKTVKVVENTSDTVHLVLPPPPPEGELTDQALDQVAGGSSDSPLITVVCL